MLLVTAATAFEMDAFLSICPPEERIRTVLTGVGPVEAALQVTQALATTASAITGVINFGVAGAYLGERSTVSLLDICLAEQEILGDLGICIHDQVAPLRGEGFSLFDTFLLHSPLLQRAEQILRDGGIIAQRGTFITVNCVSGTRQRGDILARQHRAICENMEGAAVARVCAHFQLPLVEVRCISNLVDDRDPATWRLRDACRRCGEVVAHLVQELAHV